MVIGSIRRGELLLVFLPLLVILTAHVAQAQLEIIQDQINVVRHDTKPTTRRFKTTPEVSSTKNRKQVSAEITLEYTIENRPVAAIDRQYDGKANCTAAAVRENPVLFDSAELGLFDIVYYNPDDPNQVRRAELWHGPTAPYLVGDLANPYRQPDRQQEFGRFFDIRCLPTRVHYVYVGSDRVERFREGEYAWDDSVAH